VVSLWYRAPELLLQQNHTTYNFGIDLWAVGCVFGEMLQGYPLLDGRDEMDQITKMTASLGMPPLRLYSNCQVSSSSSKNAHTDLWDRFSNLSTESLTLLTKLLEYDPEDRYTDQEALDCDYFTSKPLPANEMPRFDRRETNSR
jgi:serine/threonine protein kinase